MAKMDTLVEMDTVRGTIICYPAVHVMGVLLVMIKTLFGINIRIIKLTIANNTKII